MAWGSVISLMDQKLYGQTMVFMVNMIVCSVIFHFDKNGMSIPYAFSTILLVAALPFFQSSNEILIGHYTNISIYVTISWVISRIMYRSYCDNYISNKLLHQANISLENEIKENSTINTRLSIANAQLIELALVDDLTKLPNRRGFHAFLDNMTSDDFKEQMFSIIMIDIDYFKMYNDYFGHQYGDKVLINVAECLNKIINNANSIAVRWGGEEFIYAVFNTSLEDDISTAHTIRHMVLDLRIPNHGLTANPYLSISLGICTSNIVSVSEISNVIKRADEALYKAKRSGRNCVATYRPDGCIICEDVT
jgi:diguanylate cyclase (GGDEF)-like protein